MLVFCPTKNDCEKTAAKLSVYLSKMKAIKADANEDLSMALNIKDTVDEPIVKKAERESLISDLRNLPCGLCPILSETIKQGIAYHHSGLTTEERKIIEDAYRKGILCIIAATSTLSTGINLPAKAVIFHMPYIGMEFINNVKYKQMSGRAGRTGFDPKGESIIVCNAKEKARIQSEVFSSFNQNVKSGLNHQELSKGILEAVSSGLVLHLSELKQFLEQTLRWFLCTSDYCHRCNYSYSENLLLFDKTKKPFKDAPELMNLWIYLNTHNTLEYDDTQLNEQCRNCLLQYSKQVIGYLLCMKLLIFNNLQLKIIPTPIGKGAFAGCIPPVMAFGIYEELQETRKRGIRLDTDLQLLYLTTAVNDPVPLPKWNEMVKNYRKLKEADKAIATEYGINEDLMYQYKFSGVNLRELLNGPNAKKRREVLSVSRFYLAMILNDIIYEYPLGIGYLLFIGALYKAYSINRGELQVLQNNAGIHAGMLATFCERTCMPDLALLFHRIAERLRLSIQEELLDIMRIRSLRAEK